LNLFVYCKKGRAIEMVWKKEMAREMARGGNGDNRTKMEIER
jgi:hypothetical protein